MRFFRSVGSLCMLAVLMVPGVQAAVPATDKQATPDTAVLGRCYMKFLLNQQVVAQADSMVADAAEADRPQVKQAASTWSAGKTDGIRKDLAAQFGANARVRFEQFVADYTSAEKAGDKQYLSRLSGSFNIAPVPVDYAAFRKAAIDSFLQPDVADASKWLGEVQTWIDVRKKTPGTPDLSVWLTRDQPVVAVRKPTSMKKLVAKPKPDSLAGAEAEMGEFTAEEEEPSSPLDNFDDMRKKRRDRMLEESQAGMEQVASERQAAEEEYAAKKMAAAQAEAEAMKRQADKLAAVEKDALEQRKNSWGSRLKAIVGATISATTGAFTGGIGTRAGQEAANAIFKDN